MKRFILDYTDNIKYGFPKPDDEIIKRHIWNAGNKEFTVGSDFQGNVYIECEYKPIDLLVYGIEFVEIMRTF